MKEPNMICVLLLIPGKDVQKFVYDNEVFEDRKYAKQRINDALECGATICSFPVKSQALVNNTSVHRLSECTKIIIYKVIQNDSTEVNS